MGSPVALWSASRTSALLALGSGALPTEDRGPGPGDGGSRLPSPVSVPPSSCGHEPCGCTVTRAWSAVSRDSLAFTLRLFGLPTAGFVPEARVSEMMETPDWLGLGL